MSVDSVVFEIQVERPLLEEILNNNENFKDNYEKTVKLEMSLKTLTEENVKLKKHTIENQQTITDLKKQNLELKHKIEELEGLKKVEEQKDRVVDLNNTETRLLTLKLQSMEQEKRQIISDFQNERQVLEDLFHDQTQLNKKEAELQKLKEKHHKLHKEMDKIKEKLRQTELLNDQLDKDKLVLEHQIEDCRKNLLIMEAKHRSNDLQAVEGKIIKLKLETLEKEKQRLMDDFEKEISISSQREKPRIARLEENLKLLKNWIEREAQNRKLFSETRNEKMLKEKVVVLEAEKKSLMEGFEMERKIFRRILKNNNSKFTPILPQ